MIGAVSPSTVLTVTTVGGSEIAVFGEADSIHGTQLWRTDGTRAGTRMLDDINRETQPSLPTFMGAVASGRTVIFTAYDGARDAYGVPEPALWRTNGTRSGTTFIRTSPGYNSFESGFASTGTEVYFEGADDTYGPQIWRTDGTPSGTVRVTSLSNYPPDPNYPEYFVAVGSKLFFEFDDQNGTKLYATDTSPEGASIIGPAPDVLASVGDLLYFSTTKGNDACRLWKSDGTKAGTVLVRDLSPRKPCVLDSIDGPGQTVFVTTSGRSGASLWVSDGTKAGTHRVFRFPQTLSIPTLTPFNGYVYFKARDSRGRQLWRSDGTAAGTAMVRYIENGRAGSTPSDMTAAGSHLFFVATTKASGAEVWSTTGSAASTHLVRDILPGLGSSSPANLVAWNGQLYFSADDGKHGLELWTSDGTVNGTRMVRDIFRGPFGSGINGMLSTPGHLFFAAEDGVHGVEPWVVSAVGHATQ
jgi:ELWxxDGT repeat protein